MTTKPVFLLLLLSASLILLLFYFNYYKRQPDAKIECAIDPECGFLTAKVYINQCPCTALLDSGSSTSWYIDDENAVGDEHEFGSSIDNLRIVYKSGIVIGSSSLRPASVQLSDQVFRNVQMGRVVKRPPGFPSHIDAVVALEPGPPGSLSWHLHSRRLAVILFPDLSLQLKKTNSAIGAPKPRWILPVSVDTMAGLVQLRGLIDTGSGVNLLPNFVHCNNVQIDDKVFPLTKTATFTPDPDYEIILGAPFLLGKRVTLDYSSFTVCIE